MVYYKAKKLAVIYKFMLSVLVMSILLITAMISASSQANAVALRDHVVISDSTIKLGDIFSGLPADADKVLGPAPQPGKDMTLNARTLMRVAIALDLPWRPTSGADQVTLTRAATLVKNDQIKDAVIDALTKEGIKDRFDISLNGPWPQLILPQTQRPSVEVSFIDFDASRDWFQATLVAPSRDNPIHTTSIAGRVNYIIEVPVLRETIRHGTVIGKRDIDTITMDRRDIQPDMALHADDMIGLTPRRVVLAGKPITMKEVEAPRIVERGDTVTMIFQEGPLRLTAKGRAMENGAKGDYIRVVNDNSNRTIQGMVTGEKQILVETF